MDGNDGGKAGEGRINKGRNNDGMKGKVGWKKGMRKRKDEGQTEGRWKATWML